MSEHLTRALEQIKRGKGLDLVKSSLTLHFREATKEIEKVPCGTCDTLVDDKTCPECNGEGVLNGTEWVYKDVSEEVDAWVKHDELALKAYRQKCLDVKAKYPKE